jgi:rhamnopyranosyl-N-acetylglucosaminyl-diphospho-decaprenol beta-1,3/1,4-galactofuranosyltransferase
MRVIAVVVTYNRLAILKECIAAVEAQERKADKIIVINNGSTDGTLNWLNTQPGITTITQENSGGAGGFYRGIKEAYLSGADYIWLMDDDTIVRPDTLHHLLSALEKLTAADDEFGFVASKVVWTDGSQHLMNRVEEVPAFEGKQSREYYKAKGIVPIMAATFVSVLLSREAVKRAGLPLKSFFIWHDDIEYTVRVTRTGMKGGLVPESIAVHKTPTNYKDDIYRDDAKNAWKYKYGLRNQLYCRRHDKSYGSFVRNILKRSVALPVKILLKRKTGKWPFIKAVWQSCWSALWFNPAKEFIEDDHLKTATGK